ncbi:hypothetical protein [Serratia marcescens]|uniref:hypothetical protein n=1 Tax=Serratia marcescens TaxID=615 RepID=UPI00178815D0|nr:hypothetical protein [Serratia marcescens]
MSDNSDSLLFPRRTKPDDFKDHTLQIIWKMRNGYRRHYGIVELPPEIKKHNISKVRV